VDAVDSRTMAESLDRENLSDPAEREFLFIELRHYLRIIDLEMDRATEARQNDEAVDPDMAEVFFRAKERNENVKQLLQYMMAFLAKIPLREDIERDIADPFAQFKTFANFQISLLLEADVRRAILREYRKRGLVNDGNEWYYKLAVVERCEEEMHLVKKAVEPSREDWNRIFRALQDNCRFWFEVRQLDMKRIRKSDVYIYRLSRLLLAS
jgi:hypothetical protein